MTQLRGYRRPATPSGGIDFQTAVKSCAPNTEAPIIAVPSLTLCHTRPGSTCRPHPTNAGRAHSPVSPADVCPEFCINHSRNTPPSRWPNLTSHQVYTRNPFYLRLYLLQEIPHRQRSPGFQSYTPGTARRFGRCSYTALPTRPRP